MAFGAELKDFVAGFQVGRKIVDDSEDRKERKEDREYRRTRDEEDRNYRRERDTVGDAWRDKTFNAQERERGAAAGRWSSEHQLREDELKERRDARRSADFWRLRGANGSTDTPEGTPALPDAIVPGQSDEPAPAPSSQAIPDGGDDEQSSYRPSSFGAGSEQASVMPAAYSQGDPTAYQPRNGQEIAYNMVQDLQEDYKMPDYIAKGITGALAAETGGFSQMQEQSPMVPGSKGGYGYAQWTGPRRKQFEEYAGGDANSYDKNYGFLRHELDNTNEGAVLDKLRGARSAEEAQRIFTDNFLRPGIPNYEGRSNWTRRVEGLFAPKHAVNAAAGGLIASLDDHIGAIPDDEEEVTPEGNVPMPEAASEMKAIDDGTPEPSYAGTATEVAENDKTPTKKDVPKDPYEAGRMAVLEGLKSAAKEAGGAHDEEAISDDMLTKAREAYLKGYGAARPQMMKMVIDKVDPDRTMNPGERNMIAMGTVYRYYMDRGETDKAQAAAGSMLQYYRQQSQQFLALGQAALQNGDYDNAAKAAIQAYTQIPNGRDLKVEKNEDGTLTVHVTDAKTGKDVTKKVMNPTDFAAAAMQFNPTTFDDEILNAAGQAAPKFEAQSPESRGKVADHVQEALGELAGRSETEIPQETLDAVSSVASSIAGTQENNMDAGQAVRFAHKLSGMDEATDAKDKNGFHVKPVRGNPDRVVVSVGNQKVTMDRNALADLTNRREAYNTEKTTQAAEDKATAEGRAKNVEKFGKFFDMFKQGVDERTDQMEQGAQAIDEGRTAGDLGASIGSMVSGSRPVPQSDPAGPMVEDSGLPRALPDQDPTANRQNIETLLSQRAQLMKSGDPRAAEMVQRLTGRLRQLGYTGQ